MEQYDNLMEKHSKAAVEKDKAVDSYNYFKDLWTNKDDAFKE